MSAVLESPPARQLAVVDLLPLALARFGDWRVEAAALVAKYTGVAFDCSTVAGLKAATDARAEVRAPRYQAQTVSKASKSELAKISKAIGAEEQAIIDALAATEEAIDAQIRADADRRAVEKAERERVAAERVAGFRARIKSITDCVTKAQGLSTVRICSGMTMIEALDLGAAVWEEFHGEAVIAVVDTLAAMQLMWDAAQAREAEAAAAVVQRIEQARIAAEQAIEAKRLRDAAEAMAAQQRAIDAQIAALAAQQKALADAEAARLKAIVDAEAAREQADAAKAEAAARARGEAEAAAVRGLLNVIAEDTAPATVKESLTVQAAAEVAAVADTPRLNLGVIQRRLRMAVTSDFLADMGFVATHVGAAKMYHERDFFVMCRCISAHVLAVGGDCVVKGAR
jgi:hypothetical protein